MTINKQQNGTALTLAVEGRLDTITSPELEAALKEMNTSLNDKVKEMSKEPSAKPIPTHSKRL